ncbi:LacI family DNA-binding transcriptional regulator, partial [Vibrio natriegens]
MATIKDVAKYAGVSTSTVSHVLNKTRFVSEDISV